MTSAELNYIIQEGESYLVEFKERVSASLAGEIVAFANASGAVAERSRRHHPQV